ncbi:MAG: HD domain-containing protein [Planctomycetes bacterium]|nr:HD domain-containing protein [Planctomycetota bacterium]
MEVELIWQTGKTGTTRLDLEPGQSVTIGRGGDTELRLSDARLSRRHCVLSRTGGKFTLEDLNSQNGTFLNGKPVKKSVLSHGDKVSIGAYTFVFGSKAETETTTIEIPSATTEIKLRYEPQKKEFLATTTSISGVQDLERVKHDLEMIYRIGNLVSSEQNPSKLFQRLLEAIMEALPADRGFLLLVGNRGLPFEIVARSGTDSDASFSRTVIDETVMNGVSILTADPLADTRFQASDSIAIQNLRSIMCVPLKAEDRIIGAIYLDSHNPMQRFAEQDLHLLSAVGVQAGMAIQRAKLVDRLQVLFFDTVRALVATIETKDPYTKGHSERVSALAVQIGKDLKIPSAGLRTIQLAGLMHDIGKIGVPEQILNKPGQLSDAEYELIQRHPSEGIKIIKNIRYVENLIGPVLHHHERWDGKGYPEGQSKNKIPLGARIIAVADAFDAMTSARPYRPAIPFKNAVQELQKKAGQQFDPDAVKAFVSRFEKGRLETPDRSFSDTIAEGIFLKEEDD